MAKGRGTGSKTPKGQLPKNFDLLREKNLKNRSPEERKRISQMGVEKRKKNKEERMQLQKCMRAILEMKPNSKQKEELLIVVLVILLLNLYATISCYFLLMFSKAF